ncbi:Putative transposase for insertion sequence element IS605 family protein [Paenibacillus terrae HPL-003]|uniref:Putative transposase for insertion sequence element IS605 family protein n=1 Tax=Paenibacillus terrae (strain HPL-003) TaxID=985665 RepID=G7VZ80_PAETH|nr:Putative transposase for insertion sequence element IS605 family protein [Paenibacillus terrae HPL-003]
MRVGQDFSPKNLRHKAYKYRIYPNLEQQTLIHRTLGCCRFVFNHFLAMWNDTYAATGKGLSYNACATQLPALKQQYDWLKKVDSIALQSAVRNVADGFDRFFQKQNDCPRFKSRKHPVQSYTTKYTNGNIAIVGNQLKLPKLGWIRFANSTSCEGRILSATVRRNATGKYFVSMVCEVHIQQLPPTYSQIGIDLGLKTFAVSSDGMRVSHPKALRPYEKKLAFWQRRMARRMKGGSNWGKAKLQVARIHERIARIRQDFLHKLSTKLIRENQTISIEDLKVSPCSRTPSWRSPSPMRPGANSDDSLLIKPHGTDAPSRSRTPLLPRVKHATSVERITKR